MAEDNDGHQKIEPIVLLLFAGIIFFTLLLIAISKWSPADGQTFQVISSLLAGFGGAFMMRVKPPDTTKPLPPGSTTATETISKTQVQVPPTVEPKPLISKGD